MKLFGLCNKCQRVEALEESKFPNISDYHCSSGLRCNLKWVLSATQIAKLQGSKEFKQWCFDNRWDSEKWNSISGILLTEPTLVSIILEKVKE